MDFGILTKNIMTKAERFEGCIIGGAIGDAFGSGYENQVKEKEGVIYLYGKPEVKEPKWRITKLSTTL